VDQFIRFFFGDKMTRLGIAHNFRFGEILNPLVEFFFPKGDVFHAPDNQLDLAGQRVSLRPEIGQPIGPPQSPTMMVIFLRSSDSRNI